MSLSKYDSQLNAEALVKVKTLKENRLYTISKRLIDFFGASVGLIITSPVFLLISILYLFGDQKGPIFFKQQRLGRNGRVFYIYKFRSMIVNAEDRLRENKALYEKYVRNNYKLEAHEDPRITKIGRFLRETSLDELPQFINIIKGDMSLVGPRPVVLEELKEYGEKKAEFLSVKPGATGYWQAYGRSNIDYPERVDVELFYVKHMSMWLDIRILFRTVISVLKKDGAY